MKTYPTYECELCGYTSRDRAEVEACEATGTPTLPHWAMFRVGQQVRGFGEDGVQWRLLHGFELCRSWGRHIWFAKGDFRLSHNQREEEYGVPLSALDPLCGWDFLRYVDDVDDDIYEWATCCAEYGVEPDPARASWFEHRGVATQRAVLDAVEKWRASR